MLTEIVVDHARLSHTGRTEYGSAIGLACLLTALMAPSEQIDCLAKPRMEDNQLVGVGDTLIRRLFAPPAAIGRRSCTLASRHGDSSGLE
jgi:hypothetical protein